MRTKKPSLFKRAVRLFLIILAAIWMIFEEWVWDSLVALMERLGRLTLVNRFERFLARQHQYLLLALFIFPFLIMIPAKVYGLLLITGGKVIRGATIFVLAKLMVTALVTRLFVISKDKLLLIKPFATFYYWFTEKKEWLYAEVRKLAGWQLAKKWISHLKTRLSSLKRSILSKGTI